MDQILGFLSRALDSPINQVACLFIAAFFSWEYFRHLLGKVRPTGAAFKRAANALNYMTKQAEDTPSYTVHSPPVSIFPKSKKYQAIWQEYTRAWNASIPKGRDAVGFVDVEKHFTIEMILGNSAYLRKLDGVPGRLLSLGILGTFIGLAYGLSTFPETADSKVMANAALDLIKGLSVAFVTSIIGIISSLVFLASEKHMVGNTLESIHSFYRAARSQYPILHPEETLALIAAASEAQADSLSTLENDLAATLSESFGGAVQEHLAPLVKEIHETVSRATDSSAQVQIDGVEKIINEFMSGMHEQLGGSFQELGSNIETASTHLGSLTERLESAAIVQMELMDQTTSTAKVLDKQLPELLAFGEHLNKSGEQFRTAIAAMTTLEESLTTGANQLIGVQKETETRLAGLIKQLKESSDLSQTASNSLIGSQERMEKTYKEALDSFERTVQNGLTQSLRTFDSVLSEILERFSGTLAELKEQYEALNSYSKDLKEGVESASTQIAENLSEVGDLSKEAHIQIRDLSKQYVENMNEGLHASSKSIAGLETAATAIASNLDALQAGLIHIIESGTRSEDSALKQGWRTRLLGGGR